MKKIAKFLESAVMVKVKHPGILEIPEGKSFDTVPVSHYKGLMKKKGRPAIMKALVNLERWNKKEHPSIANKARKIINQLKLED